MSETMNTAAEPEQLRTEQAGQDPEEHGAQSDTEKQSERLFTQEEVNGIVRDRLQRDREKRKTEQTGQQAEQAAALDARAADLAARESRLDCKAFLLENGYPEKLLDIIDTSDPKEFERKAAEAASAFKPARPRNEHRVSYERPNTDVIAKAFHQDTKHKPKGSGVL